MSKPWYETTRRWGQTNLTEDDPARCDLDFWRKQWKRTHVQGVIVNCGGIVAYYPSKYELQHRAESLGGRDFFGEFSAAAREAGLVVIARMDINRVKKDFYDAHPDWFCVDKNGEPYTANGRYLSCVSGGYYTEYIPSVLREIIEKYHPEGFADNSWKGLGRNTICYCDNCKKSFRAAAGMDLPEAPSWDDPVYRAWVRWGYRRRTEIWDTFNQVTTEAGGPDCLWAGMLSSDPHNLGNGLSDLHDLCRRAKIIFCDHQARDRMNGFEQNGMNGALLRLSSQEQVLVPESMANYARWGLTFRLAANPAEETRMWMLDGIAGGISPWFHHIGGGQNDSRQFETPVPVFNWHKNNEEYLYNREDTANIGLVWSQNNADLYGRGNAHDKTALPWRGFALALTKARMPFLPVNAADINKYAGRLKTLILPDVAVLSTAELDAVCAFAEGGGGLVFTGASATLGAEGEPSADDRLWKLTGLRRTNERAGAAGKASGSWEEYETHNYLLLPDTRHEILSSFEGTRILPFGGSFHITESSGPLEPAAGYVPSFPIYPPEFSYIREECPGKSTLYAGTLAGGARVVYFAADIDRINGRDGLPDHCKLLSEAVLWTLQNKKQFTVEGPGYLDCRMYRQQNRLILHIVNLSGSNAIGYCDEIYPVGPVRVTVPASMMTQGHTFTRALLTVAGTEQAVKQDERAPFTVTVDRIDQHEMIVFM